ncbi:hypothetical protein BU24DRAFT_177751 [Aaosphaeria arxii CBS 175.79]|uniref:Zn(2)-C6 fungal-type domain-containing protein n=1 Tax=Aaosphaeria arxii CBS 175.79 TaxID=1450172 RepID=A0A6A5XR51_9PLEO|nr:uncharacterized protein BU24DRAFT_177751 [Aaosphaeria arxii CBS 175.79]KAF2015413.1 hypothetical protein BU24DRAFT_177751 [Aaosphaeria arxii CBS 175.79]
MGDSRPRQRKFAPRSRQGCLTCRARRKRCDEKRPDCHNCTRLNLKCEWQTQRQIVPEAERDPSPQPSTSTELIFSPRASLDPWDSLPGEKGAESKHLLQYYIEAFVPSISVASTPSSFYTSLYIPMAFQSNGILDAITALSSAQLARRTTNPQRVQYLQQLSAKHQVKCHEFIRERISPTGEPISDTYQVIGMLMLLVGLECLLGNKHTKWLSQMRCARKLLNSLYLDQGMMTSWELESLHRHFTYHDVMASLMTRASPSDTFYPSERDFSPFLSLGDGNAIDPLMGISYTLCSLIRRIQYVTAPNPAFPHLSGAAFKSIEEDIKQWTYESPLSSPCIDLPLGLDLIALAESYRLAALIQLYHNSEEHKPLIPVCAARAMQFLSRIPPGSPAESSMLYPMFLAGAELDEEAQIALCFQRLSNIQERNRYENVGMVQQVLQEVWRPTLNGQEKRDWAEVLKEWNWSFSLG